MNLTAIAIEKRAVTYFSVFLLFVGGLASFFALGQLEDPAYTVKNAAITTTYPGASPEEVELEVTDRIEVALQELHEIDYIESFSGAGFSLIKVTIKPEFWSDRLPQVWDSLRRKIRDIEETLPPGAGRPDVVDDFGDVFGFQLAVTGDGFSYAELEEFAKDIRKELGVVEGVARIDFWGVQKKAIYLDVAQTQLSQLGLTDENIEETLRVQNKVVDAGSVDLQDKRYRIAPSGEFASPEDIADLTVRASFADSLLNLVAGELPRSAELIRIRDFGTVRRGYQEPPFTLMRFNGEPAIGISLTNIGGINIVDMGRAVDARLEELIADLPVGVEVRRVHWQSDLVAEAVNGFLINFAEAVAIVLVVITLFMGVRMGFVIGFALITTILGTFILMAIFGVDLQRMSLGALVIALGMMVDNAIVVADGYAMRLKQGMDPKTAAIESATVPSWPLLGATVVAVMAFYPIFASTEGAGEYCRTLFTVVAMSLLTSWVISVTVTPLQCMDLLKPPKDGAGEADLYGGRFFSVYRGFLEKSIRVRWLTLGIMVGLLVVAIVGFGNVKQLFFPVSSMPKLMIDYWAPEGTRIQQVAADLKKAEKKLLADERIANVATFIGSGPPRFYLPVEPESPNQSYAQFIVNVHAFRDVSPLVLELDPWFRENMSQALVPFLEYGVGVTNTWKVEIRISGPAVADAGTLRRLARQAEDIAANSPYSAYVKNDWRQRVQRVTPRYSQERGRWASVTREDIANTTKRAFDGRVVGLYREKDDLIPIVLRQVEEERRNVGGLDTLQVQPGFATDTVPLSQVTDGVEPEWEDPLIGRRDRRRTITVQVNAVPGETSTTLRNSIVHEIEAIELPPGYTLEWGSDFEGTKDSQASLIPGLIPATAIVAFIIIALFHAVRPPLVILCTIPFAAIGITAGLLAFDIPFGFVPLLGAMSLAGMMIKNAIVLLDQVNIEIDAGSTRYRAVLDAAVSRLTPVALAAATTVLGVIPLLQDVFWIGMAVVIMAGLTFGTVLTMVLVPVLYAIFFRIGETGEATVPAAAG